MGNKTSVPQKQSLTRNKHPINPFWVPPMVGEPSTQGISFTDQVNESNNGYRTPRFGLEPMSPAEKIDEYYEEILKHTSATSQIIPAPEYMNNNDDPPHKTNLSFPHHGDPVLLQLHSSDPPFVAEDETMATKIIPASEYMNNNDDPPHKTNLSFPHHGDPVLLQLHSSDPPYVAEDETMATKIIPAPEYMNNNDDPPHKTNLSFPHHGDPVLLQLHSSDPPFVAEDETMQPPPTTTQIIFTSEDVNNIDPLPLPHQANLPLAHSKDPLFLHFHSEDPLYVADDISQQTDATLIISTSEDMDNNDDPFAHQEDPLFLHFHSEDPLYVADDIKQQADPNQITSTLEGKDNKDLPPPHQTNPSPTYQEDPLLLHFNSGTPSESAEEDMVELKSSKKKIVRPSKKIIRDTPLRKTSFIDFERNSGLHDDSSPAPSESVEKLKSSQKKTVRRSNKIIHDNSSLHDDSSPAPSESVEKLKNSQKKTVCRSNKIIQDKVNHQKNAFNLEGNSDLNHAPQKGKKDGRDRSRYFERCVAVFSSEERYHDFRKSKIAYERLKSRMRWGFTCEGKRKALLEFKIRTYAHTIENGVKEEYHYPDNEKFLESAHSQWDQMLDSNEYPNEEEDYGLDEDGNEKVISLSIHRLRPLLTNQAGQANNNRETNDDVEGSLKKKRKIEI